jgi:hypothetical protein
MGQNEPKNEAEKLLKTNTCGKSKPENEATELVENTNGPQKRTGENVAYF